MSICVFKYMHDIHIYICKNGHTLLAPGMEWSIYVYVYTCVYVYIHNIYIHIYIYILNEGARTCPAPWVEAIDICLCVYFCAYNVYVFMQACVSMWAGTHIVYFVSGDIGIRFVKMSWVSVCIYAVEMCVCICVCVCVYLCTYIYKHTYMKVSTPF